MAGYKLDFDFGIHAAIDTANTLHQAYRIPMDVVVDDPRSVLKIETFGQDISRNQNTGFRAPFLRERGAARSIVIGREPLDHVGPISFRSAVNLGHALDVSPVELPLEVPGCVSELGKNEDLLP